MPGFTTLDEASIIEKGCFVIIPYDKKLVEGREIDFEWIYDQIFAPSIRSVTTSKGETIQAFRCKDVYDPRSIQERMNFYLLHAATVLGDITGHNPNVMIEIGRRTLFDYLGTVIVKQPGTSIPFDIGDRQILDYSDHPDSEVLTSKETITQSVEIAHQLVQEKNSSLIASRQEICEYSGTPAKPLPLQVLLIQAYQAIQNSDLKTAIPCYQDALKILPNNALLRQLHGLALREAGDLEAASSEFEQAADLAPDYVDAYRELGITTSRIYSLSGDSSRKVLAEQSLRRALELTPEDPRISVRLGGLLEQDHRLPEAISYYDNALKLFPENRQLEKRLTDLKSGLVSTKKRILPERKLSIYPVWNNKDLVVQFHIADLPTSINDYDLSKVFSGFGDVSGVTVVCDYDRHTAHGLGNLQLPSVKTIETMMEQLHNSQLFGGIIKINTPASGGDFGPINFGSDLL